MEEEYKLIEGYENYEISNFGNVKNKKTHKLLKNIVNSDGYYCITLYSKGKGSIKTVHRLVAMTFIPNIDNKNLIDHINRDKLNNRLDNLRWVTYRENCMNTSISKKNTSTCTGVEYDKRCKKWLVRISSNGIRKHVGHFDTFDEAVKIRKEKEELYYKEFRAI